jgi:hypothetical protein
MAGKRRTRGAPGGSGQRACAVKADVARAQRGRGHLKRHAWLGGDGGQRLACGAMLSGVGKLDSWRHCGGAESAGAAGWGNGAA